MKKLFFIFQISLLFSVSHAATHALPLDGFHFDEDKDGITTERDLCPDSPFNSSVGKDGCPKETMIILLDNGKKKNAIVVSNKLDTVRVDKVNTTINVKKDTEIKPAKAISKREIKKFFGELMAIKSVKPMKFIVNFENSKKTLNVNSEYQVWEFIRELKQRKSPIIFVIGHSDTKGDDEENMRISTYRADYIAQIIKESHIQYQKLIIKSYGEKNLLIPTSDEVKEPKNRRVEVIIY